MALAPQRVRLASLALVALMTSGSWPAAAQPLEGAALEARDAEAKRACESGQVQEGTRLLTELFRLTDDGTYVFNLGRCYQQNGQIDNAQAQFRAYLLRKDVDPAAAARAREYLAALNPPQPAANAPTTAPAVAAAAPAPLGLVAPVTPAETAPSSPGRTLRIAALVSGGIGVAALATGAYFAGQTNHLEQEKRRALERQENNAVWFAEQDRKGEQAERRQWLFLGLGGAALAAGGVFYYLGTHTGHEPPLQSARALPLVQPGVAGAMIAGRF